MPLASSRSSIKKSSRQSLPATISSTTRVSRASRAVKRRASLRSSSRDSSPAPCHDKENQEGTKKAKTGTNSRSSGPTPYWMIAKERDGQKHSPRLTRSAKKQLREALPPLANSIKENVEKDSHFHGVLTFSPPNQEENRLREAIEIKRRESFRDFRVKLARENKHLLLFSKSGKPLQSFDDDDDKQELTRNNKIKSEECDAPCSSEKEGASDDGKDFVNRSAESNNSDALRLLGAQNEAYESLQTKLDMLIESRSCDESTKILKEKFIYLETQNKHLDSANRKLEEKVENLEKELKESQNQIMNMKDQILATTAKHESDAAAAKDEVAKATDERNRLIANFEETKAQMLLEKVRMESEINSLKRESEIRLEGLGASRKEMEQEKEKQTVRIVELEREVFLMKEKSVEDHSQKSKLESEKDILTDSKLKLEKEAKDLKSENNILQDKIKDLEEKFVMRKHEADSRYQVLLKEFEMKSDAHERVKTEMEDCKKQIADMQEDLNSMERNKEEERLNFQESSRKFANLQQESVKKDEQIEELSRELEAISTDLEEEQKNCQRLSGELSKSGEANEQFKQMEVNMHKEFEEIASDLEKEQKLRRAVEKKIKKKELTLTNSLEQLQIQLEKVEHQLDLTVAEKNLVKDQLQEEHQKYTKLLCDRNEVLNSQSQASSVIEEKEKSITKMNADLEYSHERLKETKLKLKETEIKLETVQNQRDNALKRMESFDERENNLLSQLRGSDRIRRELHNKVMQLSGNIRVYVRVRPELPDEKNTEATDSRKRKHDRIEYSTTPFKFPGICDEENKDGHDLCKSLVEMIEPPKDRGGLSQRTKKWQFGFDNIFNPSHGQDEVWEATEPLVQSAIDGYNVCIFAYGQTGSGKTYTMLGDKTNQGIVFKAITKIFSAKKETETRSKGKATVSLSLELLEIYNENVRDLLAPSAGKGLKVTSNEVVGSKIVPATSSEQVMEILDIAQSRRCVKATRSNSESSRSHMVFTIHYKVSSSDDAMSLKGKLHICDLAGSERLNKSGANDSNDGSLLKETKSINSSLSTLSNVIERLQQGSPNVPFRESKLTMLLQNSLGGNSKTLAIVCCNPSASHFHESLCSLRFADKVNRVELKATSNFRC